MGKIFGISDLPVSAFHSPFQVTRVPKNPAKGEKIYAGRENVAVRNAQKYTKNVRQYVKRIIK